MSKKKKTITHTVVSCFAIENIIVSRRRCFGFFFLRTIRRSRDLKERRKITLCT